MKKNRFNFFFIHLYREKFFEQDYSYLIVRVMHTFEFVLCTNNDYKIIGVRRPEF